MKLLSVNADAKTVKGLKKGFLTGILYMTPSDGSGVNLCPMAKLAKCEGPCLATAGRAGVFKSIGAARLRKAKEFNADPVAFVEVLAKDIMALIRKANREGLIPVVRLNGTTDIRWERVRGADGRTLFERFADVQFYDYTKIPNRRIAHIPNYDLTWSYSGASMRYAAMAPAGMRWAVVFDRLPKTFMGREVVDGDAYDARFIDADNVVVGLKAKGKAKTDTSGFVVRDLIELLEVA